MNQKEIQQNNALIAEFMGATLEYWQPRERNWDTVKQTEEEGNCYYLNNKKVEGAYYFNYETVGAKYEPPFDDWYIPIEELAWIS